MRSRTSLLSASILFALPFLSAAAPATAHAQHISDTTGAASQPRERTVSNVRGAMLSYANDVFAVTDRYFTQGTFLRVWHPALRRTDIGHFLSPVPHGAVAYAADIHHQSYTPSTIRSDSILRGDRPYAALLFLEFHGTTTLTRGRRAKTLRTSATFGVIGPLARGEELQTAIHRATGDFLPLGWQHQIRNDVLLNYRLHYDATLASRRWWKLRGFSWGEAGTLRTRAAAGLMAELRPLATTGTQLQPALFASAEGRAIGYDATLQGGLLNRTSPYTLRSADIERTVGTAAVQLRFDYRDVGIGGEYTWITREFRSGMPHAWGRLFVQCFF